MNEISRKPLNSLGYEFIPSAYLPKGKDEYYLRYLQNPNGNEYRKLRAFEIEVLVRSSWNGIPVRNIPVKVFYPEKGKRITHFRPFKDVTRITMLNTVFVLIAVFYIKPRDAWRSLKKKIFGSSFESNSLTPPNPTR